MSYLEMARRALKLRRQGKTNPEIKLALGYGNSVDVARAVACAALEERFDDAKLTDEEIALLKAVACAERSAIERGDGCAPKLKYCRRAFWPPSRSAYLAYKRLGLHRRGEDPHKPGSGLRLLDPYNGYVRLTPAGWALVHALEVAGAAE